MGHGYHVRRQRFGKFGIASLAFRDVARKGKTMRRSFTAVLGYSVSALTLLAAILVPFVLMGFFSNQVAQAGLHVDEGYSGGVVARTIAKDGYRIAVNQPVKPHLLQRIEPFVQITWEPASALPAQVSDDVDLDGDGRPDVHVTFAVPTDANAPLRVDVTSLNDRYRSLAGVAKESYSRLIMRTDRGIIVRVPLSGNQK